MDSTICNKKIKITKRKRNILIISISLVILVSVLIIDLYRSNNCLKVSTHSLDSEKVSSSVRVGVISDLHGKVFGEDNDVLFEKLKAQNPQIILVVGDMISNDQTADEDINALSVFLNTLCDIAPVYYSVGNHERFNPRYENIYEVIDSSEAVLLSDEYTDLNVAGINIRLGGITYYRFWDEESDVFLETFCNTENFKLLMCHHPEFYQWGIKNYDIDLTVSGHTHGGMVKLPILGPLYAPEQGWFPEFGAGLYNEENGSIAVTTGLASSPSYLPRVFNRPEIMIIDLM